MPSSPVSIWTPAGSSTPSSPAAVWDAPAAGGEPDAPAAVWDAPAAGGDPDAPAAVWSAGGQAWTAFVVSGVTGTGSAEINGLYVRNHLGEFHHSHSEAWCYGEEGDWAILLDTTQFLGTGEWPWTVGEWAEAGDAEGPPVFAQAIAAPVPVWDAPGAGGEPSSPAAVWDAPAEGGNPDSPAAVWAALGDGGADLSPGKVWRHPDTPEDALLNSDNEPLLNSDGGSLLGTQAG